MRPLKAFSGDAGTGSPQNEQGDGVSQLYVGLTYAEGKAVPQDYSEAARWHRLRTFEKSCVAPAESRRAMTTSRRPHR